MKKMMMKAWEKKLELLERCQEQMPDQEDAAEFAASHLNKIPGLEVRTEKQRRASAGMGLAVALAALGGMSLLIWKLASSECCPDCGCSKREKCCSGAIPAGPYFRQGKPELGEVKAKVSEKMETVKQTVQEKLPTRSEVQEKGRQVSETFEEKKKEAAEAVSNSAEKFEEKRDAAAEKVEEKKEMSSSSEKTPGQVEIPTPKELAEEVLAPEDKPEEHAPEQQ